MMELDSEEGSNVSTVKFFLGERSSPCPPGNKVAANPVDTNTGQKSENEKFKIEDETYKRFLRVDDEIGIVFTSLPHGESAEDEETSEKGKDTVKRSSSFGNYLKKKLLSPIIERRKDTSQHGIRKFAKESNKGDIDELGLFRDGLSVDEDDLTASSEVLDKSETPNIEQMMKTLFLKPKMNETEFKAIDPLEIERRITCDPRNLFGAERKKLQSSFSAVSKMKHKVFGKKSSSSGRIGQNQNYSDDTYASAGDVYNTNIDYLTDQDMSVNIFLGDDVCYTERLDDRARKQSEEFRRNSSPEILPNVSTKNSFISIFDIFREKKTQRNIQNRSLSKPDLRYKSEIDNRKLHRDRSDPLIARNVNSITKLRTVSSGSSFSSKRGTPVLSRESSIASPYTSKRGTPILSRDSSFASPFASKRGTPILSRDSSFASKGTPKSSRGSNPNSPFGSKRGTPKLSRESSIASPLSGGTRYSSSSCGSTQTARLNQDSGICSLIGRSKGHPGSSGDLGSLSKTKKKMSKVNSLPHMDTRSRLPTPKLKRRKSTPKLKRYRDCGNEKMKLTESELNFTKKEDSHISYTVETGKQRCARHSADIGEQKHAVRHRSESEHSNTKRLYNKKRTEKTVTSRKSRIDYHQISVDDKIEKWLENVSARGKRNSKDLKLKVHFHPSVKIAIDDYDKPKRDAKKLWRRIFHVVMATRNMSKKSSFSKKKQGSKEADDEVEQLNAGPVDPVYSLLKCAADLPRSGGKSPCLIHQHCSGQHTPAYVRYPSGGDSSGNTSKTSSPSSSVSHSPKTRRKKLNARMKSFSLDTPEPPKQLLGIDESTKKKSSSFTNTCFGVGGTQSPDEKLTFSASSLRKKFAIGKASSLEIEEKKNRSFSPSPKGSPKSQRKEIKNLYVALYNFKAKEKDDIDLRAGWRVNVTDSSKKDWWKGKTHGRTGYFPATYVIPLQTDQRVFQVLQPLNLSDGNYSIKFHKDQIVLQIGEEVDGMLLVRAANNRQALCPLLYLQQL